MHHSVSIQPQKWKSPRKSGLLPVKKKELSLNGERPPPSAPPPPQGTTAAAAAEFSEGGGAVVLFTPHTHPPFTLLETFLVFKKRRFPRSTRRFQQFEQRKEPKSLEGGASHVSESGSLISPCYVHGGRRKTYVIGKKRCCLNAV